MVMENIVAQMLVSRGHKLYFYSNPDRENKDNRMEIDFLIAKSAITNRHNISPIEVKSSGYKAHVSLDAFCKKFSSQILLSYLIYTKDVRKDQDVRCFPVYMTPFL